MALPKERLAEMLYNCNETIARLTDRQPTIALATRHLPDDVSQ